MTHGLRHGLSLLLSSSLAALNLMGCAGPGKKLEPPRVTLTHIQVQEIKVFETAFRIELRVFNTNDITMEIKGVDCEIELNDKHFASGVSNQKTKVSPYDTATIPVTVYSSVLDLVRGLLDSSTEDRVKYKLKGRLHMGGGLTTPSALPFESEGELPLPEPMGTRAEKTSRAGRVNL